MSNRKGAVDQYRYEYNNEHFSTNIFNKLQKVTNVPYNKYRGNLNVDFN